MCALHKVRVYSFSLALVFLIPAAIYAESPADHSEELLNKVHAIDERVKKIEAAQKEILAREEKILQAIDQLRIWTRRTA